MKRLKSKYYTKDQLSELFPLAGIYQLFEYINGTLNLVYIGRSVNIRGRLIRHYGNRNKKFDYFTFEFYPKRLIINTEYRMLDEYESQYQRLPKYNKQKG